MRILHDQSRGIPAGIFAAPLEDHLACLAGLFDSNDSLIQTGIHSFVQGTKRHKKIVDDLTELAHTCGIATSCVYQSEIGRDDGKVEIRYMVRLKKVVQQLQRHLKLPYKRMTWTSKYLDLDIANILTVYASERRQSHRAISVSGGDKQLSNRLVVSRL